MILVFTRPESRVQEFGGRASDVSHVQQALFKCHFERFALVEVVGRNPS